MPTRFHEPLHAPGEWGLFSITETEEELRANLDLSTEEQAQLAATKGLGHRREFLAARRLLHQMSGRVKRGELYKDAAGKPHLRDSHFHISLSHTVNYAAAIAHPNPCGIDVQRIVPKIERLAPKFVSPAENVQLKETNKLVQLHLIWSAKEALYKAYGRRELDFKEHLYIDFQDYNFSKTTAVATLQKGDVEMLFQLDYRVYEDIVLVACVEEPLLG